MPAGILDITNDKIHSSRSYPQIFRSKGYLDKVAKTVEKLLPASFMLEENRLEGLFDKGSLLPKY